MFDASPLSAIGAGFYALVAISCLTALAASPKSSRQRVGWGLLAGFFMVLIAIRLLGLEDVLREHLRDLLRDADAYQDRRALQAAASVVGGLLAVLGFAVACRQMLKRPRDFGGNLVLIAECLAAGMVALIGVRIVSLHAIDALLYGSLKLNWFLDLGCAGAVAICAIVYVRNAQRF